MGIATGYLIPKKGDAANL